MKEDKRIDNTTIEVAFTKDQILKSKRYRDKRDALMSILKDDKRYTLKEVDKALDEFNKKSLSSVPLSTIADFYM